MPPAAPSRPRENIASVCRGGCADRSAQRALPADEVRRRHDQPIAHVERIIARGQAEGAFRTDLPVQWLVTTVHTLLHAAADQAAAGRLATEAVGEILEKTLLTTFKPE